MDLESFVKCEFLGEGEMNRKGREIQTCSLKKKANICGELEVGDGRKGING